MYERLTVKTESGYVADGLMAVERLGRLEDVIERLQKEYDQTASALERLSAQGKEKTATYKQLWANKMALQETLLRLGCK
jgi:vacuolar-type H+-ATPase subunit I/STV1